MRLIFELTSGATVDHVKLALWWHHLTSPHTETYKFNSVYVSSYVTHKVYASTNATNLRLSGTDKPCCYAYITVRFLL